MRTNTHLFYASFFWTHRTAFDFYFFRTLIQAKKRIFQLAEENWKLHLSPGDSTSLANPPKAENALSSLTASI